MPLKAMEVKAFQPKDRPYRVWDEKGLYLEIRQNGSKLWFFKYRHRGVEKRVGLGAYPDVSLAEARQRRDEYRKSAQNGNDPLHDRKMAKIASRISAANSFESVGEEFVRTKLEGSAKADVTVRKARWYLAQLSLAIGARPISEVEPAEILAVLKKVEAKGTRYTATRMRAFASRVFRYGVATARCKNDPAALLSGALSPPKVKHHSAIVDAGRFGEFLRVVDEYTGGPIVKIAMQLLPHIFLRPGELRKGQWTEVDWAEAVWMIPASRTKLRRPHAVPLSHQSLSLLRQRQLHSGGFDNMFPGLRSHLKPMSENAINAAYRRMGFEQDEVTSHGLRATASTLLNESGLWHADAIERALAHGHSDAIRGTYARGQHWELRVEMAQWWSDYLDQLKRGGDVLPFHGKRAYPNVAGQA